MTLLAFDAIVSAFVEGGVGALLVTMQLVEEFRLGTRSNIVIRAVGPGESGDVVVSSHSREKHQSNV